MTCAVGPPMGSTLPGTERTAAGCERGHREWGPLMLLCVEWAHGPDRHGDLQVGEGRQVVEGAFGDTGDVVAMEGSEAEAQT